MGGALPPRPDCPPGDGASGAIAQALGRDAFLLSLKVDKDLGKFLEDLGLILVVLSVVIVMV